MKAMTELYIYNVRWFEVLRNVTLLKLQCKWNIFFIVLLVQTINFPLLAMLLLDG